MELIVVGLNYKTAPVELREKLSFSKHSLPDVLHQMSQLFPEGVILSTCNRTEIYTLVEDRQMGYTLLADFLSSTHTVPIRDFLPHLYSYMGDKAAKHLFNVTSGTDSMILGEPQILGQVRNAFMQAQEAETVGKYLSLLFRCALHAGKRVRTETGIAQGAASVSHATIEIARQTLESLAGSHVALIGAGEMGKHLALCLKDAGCTQFTIVSHSFNHAQELANTYEARALEFEALDQALLEVDLALTSLESPTIIIDRSHAEEIARQRQGKELYLVDIAVPRNIAPEVAIVPGITLFDIDDLQSVVDTNLEQRQQEMEHIEQILAEELDDFNEQWRSTMVAPVITALRQKAEDIRQGELAKMLPKLQHLSDKELNTVQTLTTRIVNKLLHEPVVDLRSKGDPEHAALISELFLLTVGEPEGGEQVAEYKGSGLTTS